VLVQGSPQAPPGSPGLAPQDNPVPRSPEPVLPGSLEPVPQDSPMVPPQGSPAPRSPERVPRDSPAPRSPETAPRDSPVLPAHSGCQLAPPEVQPVQVLAQAAGGIQNSVQGLSAMAPALEAARLGRRAPASSAHPARREGL